MNKFFVHLFFTMKMLAVIRELRKNLKFHDSGIWEELVFPLCHCNYSFTMKLRIANLAEFTKVSVFVNEIKFTRWAKTGKQQLGGKGQ